MSRGKLFARTAGLIAATLVSVAAAGPLVAQGGVNLVPWAGVYIPTNSSFEDVDNNVFDRDVSVMGGARLTFWGTGILGFEVTGGYAPARVSGETINESNTDLIAANARLLLSVIPVTTGFGLYVGAGPALLTRGSNPLDDDRSSTDFGGTVGLGFRFGSGDNSRIGVRLDIEDYLYDGDFGNGLDSFQNDLVASLGISIALGGRVDDE